MKTFICNTSIILMVALTLASCNEQSVTSQSEINQVEIDSAKTSIVNISGKLFSVPSPIQTAILIKNTGSAYENTQLHDVKKAGDYASKIDMALNMGIYGTDMAYSSLFDDGQSSLRYFKAVESLSDNLEIKGAIDVSLLERLGNNVGEADSLLVLSSQFFREADLYLKDNNRVDVAALILTGGWIESAYLTTLAAKEGNQKALTRLAEQKKTIQTIQDVVRANCDVKMMDPAFMDALDSLQMSFGSLESNYEYHPPETDVANKTTTIKSKSNYAVSTEQFEELSARISNLRDIIIQ